MSHFHPPAPTGPPERPELLGPPTTGTRAAEPADDWKPWTAFASLALALIVVIFASLVFSSVAAIFGADLEDPPPGINIGLTAVQGFIFVGAALFFAQTVHVPAARDFGLRGPRTWWLAVLLVPVVWLAFVALSGIWVEAIGQSPDEDLPDELGADESDVALVAVMILVCVVAPVGEEFLFRGYIFRALRNWHGVTIAAIVSGCIFGAIHGLSADAVALVPLSLLGIGMALIYHWTGSLYVAMTVHALNNAIAFSVTQDWEWQIPLVIVGAITATLLVGWAVQRGIDAGRDRLLARKPA